MQPIVEPLWPEGAPTAKGDDALDIPTLHIYLPEQGAGTGTAIVVCPGGGYQGLAMGHEGEDMGNWLSANGIAAFILEYRLPPRYRHPVPLQDARRAVRTVRARAEEWGIRQDRIGILGFSAGGHLAATVGTHFDGGDAEASDPIERASCRPDFMVLGYALISFMPPHTHPAARGHLMGERQDDTALIEFLSNETQVTPSTPPAFLFHTDADQVVPSEHSVLFYLALRRAGVPAELHVFEQGVHGLGLAPDDPGMDTWPDLCLTWLRERGLLVP